MAKKKSPEFIATKATDAQLNAFDRNYASDHDVAERFMSQVLGPMKDTRNNRLQLEDKWISDVRLWSCVADDLGYQGRSNVFVPELHNQIETGVEKSLMGVFPGGDMVKAVPMNGTAMDSADKIAAAVQYELEEKARIFIKHQEFVREKLIKGTGVYKGSFRKEMLDVFWRDKKGSPMKQQIPQYLGVDWDVVDLFRFYIYPETSNLENCKGVFEDTIMQKEDLEEAGIYVNLDSVSTDSIDINHQWTDVEQLNMVDLASAISGRRDGVFVTELWTKFKLGGKIVPVVGTIANSGTLLRLTRNPFWFQRHPYLSEGYTKRPGKIFYSMSMPDKIRTQQYAINDSMNQSMDSLNYSLSPITIIDPALAGDVNSMKTMPGAKWLGSPEGIKPYIFPDVSQAGFRAMAEIRGQVAQFSDNSPGLAPQLQGKSRSATQASIVQQEVSGAQKIKSRTEEVSIFQSMCKMTHAMLVQYMDSDWQIKFQGPEAGEWITADITPNDIIGEVDFVWKGASAQEKTAVRSQQLLALFKEAMGVAAMQPGEVDLAALFKRIAHEAFDLKDMDVIFKSLRDKKTVDPAVENIALWDGEDIPIHNGDDDEFHIEEHTPMLDERKLSDESKMQVLRHIEAHKAQKRAKKQVLELKGRMEAVKTAMGGEEGGEQGQPPGAPQPPPNPNEGNRGQLTNAANLMTSVKGSNPSL